MKHNLELDSRQKLFLDAFRIIAAMMVFLGHSLGYYQYTIFKDETYFPYLQNIGVVLFFLLSGFLNAYSLEVRNKDNQYSIIKFIKHKSIRFYREYIPGLICILIIDVIFILCNPENYQYYDALNIKQFIGDLFFLNGTKIGDLLGIIPFGSGRPLWTLAVEWWLCILFGSMFLLIANKKEIDLKRVMLVLIVLLQSVSYLIGGRGGGLGTVFMLGVLSYYIYDYLEHKTALVIFCGSLIAYGCYGYFYKNAYTMYSFLILFATLTSGVKFFGEDGRQSVSRCKLLSFTARSTFILYMIHYSIIEFFVYSSWNISSCIKWGTSIIVSMVSSILIFYLIENRVSGKDAPNG